MKTPVNSRQSKNVEVRQRDFPRPMGGSRTAGDAFHNADVTAYENWGKQRIKATLKDKDSPFRPMLKAMDKPQKKPSKNASVPIPSPRPDPNEPRPTVYDDRFNNKG